MNENNLLKDCLKILFYRKKKLKKIFMISVDLRQDCFLISRLNIANKAEGNSSVIAR